MRARFHEITGRFLEFRGEFHLSSVINEDTEDKSLRFSQMVFPVGCSPYLGCEGPVYFYFRNGEVMSAEKLKEFLDHEHAKYVTIAHPGAYTAQEVAESAHVPGKEMAKTVVVEMGGRMVMAVLPANRKLDLAGLREVAGNAKARLATEDEFKELFPDCEVGAMPPFGNLYGMEVYVASPLAEDEEIAFNAGSHTELIRMPFEQFQRLAHAKVAEFTV